MFTVLQTVQMSEGPTGMRRAPRKLIACISETGTGCCCWSSSWSTSGSSSCSVSSACQRTQNCQL